jgi:hypothetical protein
MEKYFLYHCDPALALHFWYSVVFFSKMVSLIYLYDFLYMNLYIFQYRKTLFCEKKKPSYGWWYSPGMAF